MSPFPPFFPTHASLFDPSASDRASAVAIQAAARTCRECRPRKPYPRTKHDVDQMTGCGDMAI